MRKWKSKGFFIFLTFILGASSFEILRHHEFNSLKSNQYPQKDDSVSNQPARSQESQTLDVPAKNEPKPVYPPLKKKPYTRTLRFV